MEPRIARSFWARSLPWWHAALALDLTLTAALTALTSHGAPLWWTLAGLALIGALYLAFGRRAMGSGTTTWQDWAYLGPAWAVFVATSFLGAPTYVLLFVLFPQSWALLSRTSAAMVSTLAMAAWVPALVVSGETPATAGLSAGIALAVSLLVGLWVTGMTEESARRADLIVELERTRAELADAQRKAGALAERQRLSHEIHDTLAQGFTSLLTLAQAAEADSGDALRDRLRLMQQTARQNLAEARALVADLAPADLDGAVLADALRRVGARFAATCPVAVDVEVRGTPRVQSRNRDVVVLRTVQEALTNVARHADAAKAMVRLEYRPGSTVLTVHDDGRGIAPGTADGFGLSGMRARAGEVGGRLAVGGGPGGTTVRLELPDE